MGQLSALEMEAAEGLLKLASVMYEPNIRRDTSTSSPQLLSKKQQQAAKTAAIVTSTPFPKPLKKRPYIEPTAEQSIKFNEFAGKCEVFSPVLNKVIVSRPIFKCTPRAPIKSQSGRTIKRTRRFIAEHDEMVVIPIKRKLPKSTKGPKPSAIKSTMKTDEESEAIIHPAKKIKIELPDTKPEEPKVTVEARKSESRKIQSAAKFKRDIFNTNKTESLLLDKIRHSRLFGAAHELQYCATTDANVERQHRAVENLTAQKSAIVAKRREFSMNRSSKALELLQKFRGIKNRQQVCHEFLVKFGPTKSAEWKPFAEDANRSADNSNYKMLQMTKDVAIKYWTQQFLTHKADKERARSMLVEVIKVLPNRPEVRHEFINGHLPKLVAAHKQAAKKNKGLAIKEEKLDSNAAFSYPV